MNREILFRGKRRDNKEWFLGYMERTASGKLTFIRSPKNEIYANVNLVIPETVGQYTGQKDKNGVKVFEGDIISIPFEEDRSPWEPNCTYCLNAEVFFSEECHGWRVRFFDGSFDDDWLWEYDECELEVVGNIHDNPELVSGSDKLEED